MSSTNTQNTTDAPAAVCPVQHSSGARPSNTAVHFTPSSSHPPSTSQPSTQSQSIDACPIARPEGCDSEQMSAPPALAQLASGCPVIHNNNQSSSNTAPSDPSRVGDAFPDATPQPNQSHALSTTPVHSIIPKSGTDGSWVFPSPQRFYNAMKKKGWDPKEYDMPFVVSIHNTVNEQAWRKVLAYEQFHSSCGSPSLLRFRGRPNDLSPKARMLGWLGYTAPFDRHDWIVDRCGTEVRYVIDFYPGQGADMLLPGMPPTIHLDVRPAATPMGIIDRIRMGIKEYFP